MTDSEKKFTQNKIIVILMLIFIAIALVAGIVAGVQAYRKHQAQDMYDQLAGDTQVNSPNTPVKTGASVEETVEVETDPIQRLLEHGVPIPEKDVDFATLKSDISEDIYAWIYIPGSEIDYPVLQHPTDNSYYLNYNLDGSRGYPGCIYTENYNDKDFTDPNTVIYGHNMKNGSMFAGLHLFEDSEYFEENPYVYLYTEDGLLVYEIFAAYTSGDEHILLSYDFDNTAVFEDYLEDIMAIRDMNANLRTELGVSSDSRIITLSTCIANRPNNRYLVQGVLLNED